MRQLMIYVCWGMIAYSALAITGGIRALPRTLEAIGAFGLLIGGCVFAAFLLSPTVESITPPIRTILDRHANR